VVGSGARTNLKVGRTSRAKRRRKFLPCPSTLLVGAFVMGSTFWSVPCLSHGIPRAQPSVKVGARPPFPVVPAPLAVGHFIDKRHIAKGFA